jgi:hypothetical protein
MIAESPAYRRLPAHSGREAQPAKDGAMKCPNCVLGDLQFVMTGEFRFTTDENGRPCGTAEVTTSPEGSRLVCDTCDASFGVAGWQLDGSGQVVLVESESATEDASVELNRESPPPGSAGID